MSDSCDVSIAGLQSYTPIKPLRVSQAKWFPFQILFTSREKNIRFGTRITNLLQSYELRGKQWFISNFSRLLGHVIEKGHGPILYTKISQDPTVNKFLDWSKLIELEDNKIDVSEKLKFVLGRVEKIVGKRENAG